MRGCGWGASGEQAWLRQDLTTGSPGGLGQDQTAKYRQGPRTKKEDKGAFWRWWPGSRGGVEGSGGYRHRTRTGAADTPEEESRETKVLKD